MREAVDAGLVVTESSGTKPDKQDTSSSSGNYTTQAVDADIGPVNDDEPLLGTMMSYHNILVMYNRIMSKLNPEDARENDTRQKPEILNHRDMTSMWIPTGKVFIDSTTKVDSEPPNGSNDDITNPYECNQTLYVSAGTSNSSAVQASLFNDKMTSVHISSGLALQRQNDVYSHQFRPHSSSIDNVCSR
ncbi:hypothetical protein Tco_0889617 [Tanacetum coccineum]